MVCMSRKAGEGAFHEFSLLRKRADHVRLHKLCSVNAKGIILHRSASAIQIISTEFVNLHQVILQVLCTPNHTFMITNL